MGERPIDLASRRKSVFYLAFHARRPTRPVRITGIPLQELMRGPIMNRFAPAFLILLSLFAGSSEIARSAIEQRPYFPPRGGGWERRNPDSVGMDSARLREAVA